MTTYESPADLPVDQFDEPGWHAGRQTLPWWAGMAAAFAAVVLLIAGFLLRGSLTVTRADACSPVTMQLTTVNKLLLEGNFVQASALAHATLAEHTVCSLDRDQLALAAYHADMDGLFQTAHQPGDVVTEDAMITAWHEIQAFGHRYLAANELESSSHIVDLAYSLGFYDLARDAWLSEWRQGGNRDTDAQNGYYSTLVNLGREWVTQAPASYREQGLSYLSLARSLGLRFGLPRAEADSWLRAFTGMGPSRWPKPAADPVLAALEKKRR